MKVVQKDKPIDTVPKGVYEGGIINQTMQDKKSQHLNDISTDSQGNGYPTRKPKDRAGD